MTTTRTTHVQALIRAGLNYARSVDGAEPKAKVLVELSPGSSSSTYAMPRDEVLERAVNFLRHAAEELDDERLRCRGWGDVC